MEGRLVRAYKNPELNLNGKWTELILHLSLSPTDEWGHNMMLLIKHAMNQQFGVQRLGTGGQLEDSPIRLHSVNSSAVFTSESRI